MSPINADLILVGYKLFDAVDIRQLVRYTGYRQVAVRTGVADEDQWNGSSTRRISEKG
jgi:hypothetical protein